ncbi:hypothetical protein JAAARDRAFT_432010 [Jaapia argillacea MUCL 33604]|uniref:Uncharacterized protein n=1 Tax=Jaapia argillacea MUCL 33604 TaxID=933084 RepID=A0A067PER6_9AGAM|nr:hypothetical protein JAAARDRAFT_432010 [Jaapia argillacea MUCL 33604]
MTWWNPSRRRNNSDLNLSGIHAVIGAPRTLDDRRSLLRDTIGGMLFRHTIFRKQRYESISIALIRGFVAFMALTWILIYAVDSLMVLPLIESAFLPVRSTANVPLWQAPSKFGIASARGLDLLSASVLNDVAFIFVGTHDLSCRATAERVAGSNVIWLFFSCR